MNLHARNVAIQAGLPTEMINQAVTFMKTRNQINVKTAAQYLKSHQLLSKSQNERTDAAKDLSSLFIELSLKFLPEPLILTVLLDSNTSASTYHLSIEKQGSKNGA